MLTSGLQKNRVSFAKSKWEISVLSELELEIRKPSKRPTTLLNSLLRVSISKINKRGGKGSPYHSPLELQKNVFASPLTSTEKCRVDIQKKM